MRRRQKSRHPTLAALVHAWVGIDVNDGRDDDANMGRNDHVPVSDRLTNEVESFNDDDNDYNSNADNENDNDGNDDSEGLKK